MEPVVGVYVAKCSIVAQAFLTRNEPYGKAVEIVHETRGFEQFTEWLETLQAETVFLR
ncbi:hypothetical protein AB4111_11455 [Paenibacillus sp. 2KB_22]